MGPGVDGECLAVEGTIVWIRKHIILARAEAMPLEKKFGYYSNAFAAQFIFS